MTEEETERLRLEEAAQGGDILARIRLAETWMGDPARLADGVELLRMIAEEGSVEAIYRYGLIVFRGTSIHEANQAEGRGLQLLAASEGHPGALFEASLMQLLWCRHRV